MSQILKEPETHPEAAEAFRLRIWHLFYLTALIAVGLFVAGVSSLVISGVVLVVWWLWHRQKFGRRILIVIVLVGFLIGMLLPTTQIRDGAPRWALSAYNIKQCTLAMLNYESAHGHCPPAWQEAEAGKPMHSWRVLILPFLEYGSLYDQYDFNEPWDGPNNSKLVDQMPMFYQNPYDRHSTGETIYKLVVDEESFFTAGKGRPLKNAADGAASTVVLVEDSANPVNWMKPDGISIEVAVACYLNEKACHRDRDETIYSKGLLFQNVATLNGGTHRIGPDIDPELLRAAMRCSDGVSPDWSELDRGTFAYKPAGFVALSMYVVLLALPGWFWKKRSNVYATRIGKPNEASAKSPA